MVEMKTVTNDVSFDCLLLLTLTYHLVCGKVTCLSDLYLRKSLYKTSLRILHMMGVGSLECGESLPEQSQFSLNERSMHVCTSTVLKNVTFR
jgi:hypothetical protein